MNSKELKNLLKKVQNKEISLDQAVNNLESLPFGDLGFAKIDNHREIRVGYPEVIYCEGKTYEQIKEIIKYMDSKNENILATRVNAETGKKLLIDFSKGNYNALGRTFTIRNKEVIESKDFIAIVSGGTSDLAVVEESYETAKILGNRVKKFTDVGVAGIHRLFSAIEEIRTAKVIIVVAGMEGALASVVGGLVNQPVIAVPTSIGYGANFQGVSALLSMLNSCASGVTVVNIDNGFGAAYSASQINKL
jgi:hypothetical protein